MQTDRQTNEFFSYDPPYSRGNYEKSLEISRKGLPADHPDLATSYYNIGDLYDNMGQYSKALEYYEEKSSCRSSKSGYFL